MQRGLEGFFLERLHQEAIAQMKQTGESCDQLSKLFAKKSRNDVVLSQQQQRNQDERDSSNHGFHQ